MQDVNLISVNYFQFLSGFNTGFPANIRQFIYVVVCCNALSGQPLDVMSWAEAKWDRLMSRKSIVFFEHEFVVFLVRKSYNKMEKLRRNADVTAKEKQIIGMMN